MDSIYPVKVRTWYDDRSLRWLAYYGAWDKSQEREAKGERLGAGWWTVWAETDIILS